MQLPKFLIKIYHKIPLPLKIKRFFRSIFYQLVTPLIKIKRLLFIEKNMNFNNLAAFKKNLNFIGIAEFKPIFLNKSLFVVYPLMKSMKLLFKEIFEENVYFKYFLIKEGELVIDAGAHIGVFSIIAAKLTGNQGRVLAIEPDPNNVKFLEWNKSINSVDNIEIIPKAIYSQKTTLPFFINELNSAASSLISGHHRKITVEADSLDNIIKKSNISKDKSIFLKMDIEGAEIEAIKGMQELLRFPKLKGVIAAYHKVPLEGRGDILIKTHTIIEPILKKNGFQVKNGGGFLYFWRE